MHRRLLPSLVFVLALFLVSGLAACSSDDGDDTDATDTEASDTDATDTDATDTTAPAGDAEDGVAEAGDPTDPPEIDDEELATFADECFEGSGDACDALFFRAEVGSAEEDYGNTCGGRFATSPGLCELAIGP